MSQQINISVVLASLFILYIAFCNSLISFHWITQEEYSVEENPVGYKNTFTKTVCSGADQPIIGLLAQEVKAVIQEHYPKTKAFVTGSYVKFLESTGAKVVPVLVNQDESYYQKIFNSTHGFLMPGGAISYVDSSYAAAARKMLELAIAAKARGDLYPIWGTCLGFELFLYDFGYEEKPDFVECRQGKNVSLALIRKEQEWNGSVFEERYPQEYMTALETNNYTAHFHVKCLTLEEFSKKKLGKFWRLLATSKLENGTETFEFASLMEAKDFPFFATQFHPEKPAFEWPRQYNSIPRDRMAIRANMAFGDFFIDYVRKINKDKHGEQCHGFESEEEEDVHLIYNFETVFSGKPPLNLTFAEIRLLYQ